MFVFHRKKLAVTVVITVIVVLQYRLLFAGDGVVHVFRLHSMISEQQAKNDDIVKRNVALMREIDSLKQGGAAIENLARGDLGMVKQGEIFYQVVE